MIKKNLLYFTNTNFHKKNLVQLENTYNIIPLESLAKVNKLDNVIKDIVDIIYCDPLYYYSKNFLRKFRKLKFLVSSTTTTDFIDLKYCKKKKNKNYFFRE